MMGFTVGEESIGDVPALGPVTPLGGSNHL